jgi:hypothetical protein
LVRFTPPICTCVDCQPLVEIHVSNSLLHPAELYVLLQPAIAALDIPSVRDQAEQFLAVKCHHAKNILASAILDTSIYHCTNLKEMQLSKSSLLIFKYHFDEQQVAIQFAGQQLHFLLKNEIT